MVTNLRQLRKKAGISQQKLGEKLGVSQQTINQYENHKMEPDIYTLSRMADLFGTTIDYLVGHTPTEQCPGTPYTLNPDEAMLVEKYRTLSPEERSSIRMVMDNYMK